MPVLTQFESGKSTIRYLPANGTAASDRSAVRTLSALLSPPAKINASVRSIVVSIRQGDKETRRNRTRLSPCLAFPLSPCLRDLENLNHPWGGVEGAPRGYPGPSTPPQGGVRGRAAPAPEPPPWDVLKFLSPLERSNVLTCKHGCWERYELPSVERWSLADLAGALAAGRYAAGGAGRRPAAGRSAGQARGQRMGAGVAGAGDLHLVWLQPHRGRGKSGCDPVRRESQLDRSDQGRLLPGRRRDQPAAGDFDDRDGADRDAGFVRRGAARENALCAAVPA